MVGLGLEGVVDLRGREGCLPEDFEQEVEVWGIKHGWAPPRFFAEDAPALDILQADTEAEVTSAVQGIVFIVCSSPIGSTGKAEYLF